MKSLAVSALSDFMYGLAPAGISCGRGLKIGQGRVIPELNFTLPSMTLSDETWPQARTHYADMIDGALTRAVELEAPDLLVEFESLPDMTIRPAWGLDITRLLADRLADAHDRHGIRTALRCTPSDTREFQRPPLMRQGPYWEGMQAFFAGAAEAGADLLSIESTGGKELCDEALVAADLRAVVFSLGVLGCRDMQFLWGHLVECCRGTPMLPAGDSACGFANTAMVLADKHMIPRLFAAVVRVASVPRSLQAYQMGAVGPSKDCAYEGPYLKAITGVPISMEGRSAACAHLSPVGNISQAVCDCWSNESVQNVQLLSARAPTVSMEQLIYDCRLVNTAAAASPDDGRRMRDWLAASDAGLDPQAYVLRPDVVLRIAGRIAGISDPYAQTVASVRAVMGELRSGFAEGAYRLPDREVPWLDRLEEASQALPDSEAAMLEAMLPQVDPARCDLSEYGIEP